MEKKLRREEIGPGFLAKEEKGGDSIENKQPLIPIIDYQRNCNISSVATILSTSPLPCVKCLTSIGWALFQVNAGSRNMLVLFFACHDSLSRQLCEEMGPRKHGLHRSKKDVQQDSNKAKHTKSLKNKIRDVQRLLKKVRQILISFYGVQLHVFQTCSFS